MNANLKELEDKATAMFLEKTDWKERYDKAPTKAKDYYRLMFASSAIGILAGDGTGDISAFGIPEERDRMYHALDDEAWNYLLKNASHAEAQGLYITRRHMQGKPDVKYGDWMHD